MKLWPKQQSGNRFEYRPLNQQWQVYGDGLRHVCYCDTEEMAKMVTDALNVEDALCEALEVESK